MPHFSSRSIARLNQCNYQLVHLFNVVVTHFDCAILEGYRGKEDQRTYFLTNRSKVRFPDSPHNTIPSNAVDVAPCINGKASYNIDHCKYFAGVVMGIAATMSIDVRWGGNWDRDEEVITDQQFQDLVHFELVTEDVQKTNNI